MLRARRPGCCWCGWSGPATGTWSARRAEVAGRARCRQRCGALSAAAPGRRRVRGRAVGRLPLLPQVIDTYILSTSSSTSRFSWSSFVLMTEVFTFFELLSDIVKNQIPMSRVLTYLFF